MEATPVQPVPVPLPLPLPIKCYKACERLYGIGDLGVLLACTKEMGTDIDTVGASASVSAANKHIN